jgi:hypothetical protein
MDRSTAQTEAAWSVRDRVARLEQERHALESWTRLITAINLLILAGIFYWLIWPEKELTRSSVAAERVSAQMLLAKDEWQHTFVDEDSAVHVKSSFVVLGFLTHGAPRLWIESSARGELSADVYGIPRLALYAEDPMKLPRREGPQIELLVVGKDWQPQIILRDLRGQVVWQAP